MNAERLGHQTQLRAVGSHKSLYIHFEHAVEILLGCRFELADVGNAGIVHQARFGHAWPAIETRLLQSYLKMAPPPMLVKSIIGRVK